MKKYKYNRKFRKQGNSMFAMALRGRRVETGTGMKWSWKTMEDDWMSKTEKKKKRNIKNKNSDNGLSTGTRTQRGRAISILVGTQNSAEQGRLQQPELTLKFALLWAGGWPPEVPSSPDYSMILWKKEKRFLEKAEDTKVERKKRIIRPTKRTEMYRKKKVKRK